MTRRRYLSALALLALLGGCAGEPPPPPSQPVTVAATPPADKLVRVPLTSRGSGTHYIPVGISGHCCVLFMLDSGASDVSISPAIFRAMYKDGIIGDDDMIGIQKYNTAAGKSVEGLRFRIPELNVGGLTVRDVTGSVTLGSDMMLLGQSFLRRFKFWAIDNRTNQLILG